jgi:hypothetical protein
MNNLVTEVEAVFLIIQYNNPLVEYLLTLSLEAEEQLGMCRPGEPEGRVQAGHQARLHCQGLYTLHRGGHFLASVLWGKGGHC